MSPGRERRDASEEGNQPLSQYLQYREYLSHMALLASPQSLTQGGRGISLTKRDNDGTGDAVCHDHGEDTHHPGVSSPKLELIGLVLQEGAETHQHDPRSSAGAYNTPSCTHSIG